MNHGAHDQEFQIIYHANFGRPLLEAGARFLGAIAHVKSFNSHAAQNARSFGEFAGPQMGFIEQVYCLQPIPGPDGRSEVMLKNPKADRGVSVAFPVEQLPCLTLWKNLAAEAEGYVTGIEPGTGFPYTRRIEREAGRVPVLGPAQSRRFTIDFTVLCNAQSVQTAAHRIREIQGRRETVVDGTPLN
jgi:hypothetical protein